MNRFVRRCLAALLCVGLSLGLAACGGGPSLHDGYYTAQAAEYNSGWKEFVTVMVKGGRIVSVEYNAENASGFIKSWDNAYMQTMLRIQGTYPNEYTRYYGSQLLGSTGEVEIDGITGASTSYRSFQKLAAAVIEQARAGDSSIVIVDTLE